MATQEFRITNLDLSAYMVKDADRAIAFYRDVLGMEPTTVYPEHRGAEYEFSDGSTFGLWDPGEQMPFAPSYGNLFGVDDLEAAVAALEAKGVTVLQRFDTPVCKMAIVNDTEGNGVVLHQRKTG